MQVSVKSYLMAGFAIAGAGALLAIPPGAPPAVSVPAPAAPAASAVSSAQVDLAALNLPLIGDVGVGTTSVVGDVIGGFIGIFVGNGADADPATCTEPCDGGNAGLLIGDGGDAAFGGTGGRRFALRQRRLGWRRLRG